MDSTVLLNNTVHYKHATQGWKSETTLPFELNDGKIHKLDITTSKRGDGRIEAIASVCTVEGLFKSFKLYEDYYKVWAISERKATARAVQDVHNEALKKIDDIIKSAQRHYLY